jgi:hypothetical protein
VCASNDQNKLRGVTFLVWLRLFSHHSHSCTLIDTLRYTHIVFPKIPNSHTLFSNVYLMVDTQEAYHSQRDSRSPRRRSSRERSPGRSRRRSYSPRSRSRSRDNHRRDTRRSRSPMNTNTGGSGSGFGGGAPPRSFEERAAAREQMMSSLRESSQQDRRVYVGNLSYDVKWHHLKDFMRSG